MAGWQVREMREAVGLGQNLETELPGLDFRHTIGKDNKGLCGEVVGRCIQCGNSGRVVGWRNEREAAGCRPKGETELLGLGFRRAVRNWGGEQWGKVVGWCI